MSLPAVLLLAPLPEFLLQPLRQVCTCHDYFHAADPAALLAEVGPEIRAIAMGGGSLAPISLLQQLPALEILSVFGVGYDGVPLAYCQERGLRVTNTPDVLTDDVADIAMALVLMTSRRLGEAERFARAGQWPQGSFPLAHALRGKRAGIVGLGRIGKAIAQRLSAHGLSISYYGRHAQAVDYRFEPNLHALAAEVDFLIVACPGGEGTRHLIDASVLAALGASGTLINIARGSIVDEVALISALEQGTIRTAGLDVFENEPHLPPALCQHEKVVLLPHLGSGTHEARLAMAQLCVGNLAAHFAGQPLLTPVI
ncbi:2-hydroxyacid dehydrogenase [Prosthecobacter dejongeii]|uniref:Lactate dehydrogenase-like 2-hydroxyacid dehydrogenase n=1 Tax=Prosthecobacter dejongeii TaxID=48465 RepID=A0A7W7YLU4_9BACT|nr:2-hydroxyacid dehydrogenase [Prosthecobacter dejongeii]MBB5038590.1 lactate dehydrogenase-like 2-hydroxyacid dehydrogenase [Prosthecobacter dejongeii]